MIKPAEPTTDDADKLLSMKDLASRTGLHPRTLTDLCTTKQLKHVQIGTGKFKPKRWVRWSWWVEYEQKQLAAAMGPPKDDLMSAAEREFIRQGAERHRRGSRKA